jgi:hypothetical protein
MASDMRKRSVQLTSRLEHVCVVRALFLSFFPCLSGTRRKVGTLSEALDADNGLHSLLKCRNMLRHSRIVYPWCL